MLSFDKPTKLFKNLKSLPTILRNREKLAANLLTMMSHNSVWIYSLRKSGTTYTALFLSNYFDYLYGSKDGVTIDSMGKKYCIHSLSNRIKKNVFDCEILLKENLFYSKGLGGYSGMFTTHDYLSNSSWERAICLYRNPLDYCISFYFYHYINRGIKIKHPRKILDKTLKDFAKTYLCQKKISTNYPESVLRLSYEEIVTNPRHSFKKMIEFLNIPFSEDGMEFSLNNSSKKKIKEREQQTELPAVIGKTNKNFKLKSFIRSGKIGEWKDYFNEEDIKHVNSFLKSNNINPDDFIIE